MWSEEIFYFTAKTLRAQSLHTVVVRYTSALLPKEGSKSTLHPIHSNRVVDPPQLPASPVTHLLNHPSPPLITITLSPDKLQHMFRTRSYALLFLAFFLVQCDNGAQHKAEFLKVSEKSEAKPSEAPRAEIREQSDDFDPYFTQNSEITTKEGPGTITRHVMQDRKGNIWLATWKGIMLYDGTNFINHTNKEGLRRHRVFCILEDKSGNIWFGTIGAGLYRYDGKTFTNLTTEHGLVSNKVHCLYEDTAGRIWVGANGGISIYDPTVIEPTDETYFDNRTVENGLPEADINTIIEDTGKFWIGSRGLTYTYDGKKFTKVLTQDGQPFANTRRIIRDSRGAIWLGGNSGLWRYQDDEFTQISKPFVGYIYEDREGNIWTSSESAEGPGIWVLTRYETQSLPLAQYEPKEVLRQENMFFDIMEDSDGNIWVGKLDGTCRISSDEVECFGADQ